MLALLVLGAYFVGLVMFQSRLTWENFDRQLHITQTARPPFTVVSPGPTLSALSPEAVAGGLVRGDRLLALDGKPARGERSAQAAVNGLRAGEILRVTVERNGVALNSTIRLQSVSATPLTLTDWILFTLRGVLTPWFCLILGFGVAFQRPTDPLAWLLVMLLMSFGGVAQAGNVLAIAAGWEMPTRPLAVMYYLTMTNSWGFWMMLFGQYFPDRSGGGKWDRIVRWLLGVPLAGYALLWGVSNASAIEDVAAMRFEAAVQHWSTVDVVLAILGIGVFFANVFLKMKRATTPDARRRLRLLASGAGASLTPVLLLAIIALLMGRSFLAFVTFSPWLWIPALLLLFLFPVTLAYVIVVAHAMEVDVVIRQGLQYALARGGARLLTVSVVVVVAIYSVRIGYEPGVARSRLWVLLGELAAALLLVRLLSDRLYGWIDRHFFREAVNSERVLGELSEKVRTIVETGPLLQTVAETIASALHINRVVALVRQNGDFVPAYALGFGVAIPDVRFSAKGPVSERLVHQRQPLQSPAQMIERTEEKRALDVLEAELLLPMSANDRVLGFLSLGPKRSEAPYSALDIRLLETVAVQTGLALENSRLTAEMAREIAQRERLAHELEIAREVQERMFPQQAPSIAGLDYAGQCLPAATVGGDYYDFLVLPGGRFGFAIGDVSGKGIPAALLMASLRASLRGLAITHSGTIAEMMSDLNQVIYEASPVDRFATLFYGVFDPASRSFTYVNAGHNAPILWRADSGGAQRLAESGLMIGGFRSAQYQQSTVMLGAADTIVMFTDGISEAPNSAGEEFGEKRIIDNVHAGAGLPAAELVHRILGAVESFSAGAHQYDDITLVVVRVDA